MLYGKGAKSLPFYFKPNDQIKLIQLSKKIVKSMLQNQEENIKNILSIRILVAPQNYQAQDFHLDYKACSDVDAHTIFLGLTPSTKNNCTEILIPNNDFIEKKN